VPSGSHISAIVIFRCFIRVQEECIRIQEELVLVWFVFLLDLGKVVYGLKYS